MSDWTAGDVADVGYTFGVYAELNPQRIQLAFLMAGLVPPQNGTACELGFGQGMSVNIHAAASVTEWHGTDFNPSQAAFARELADASGANAHLNDQSFAEFCSRDDLPEFDFIGLHGIFSWISDENRHIIVDFIRRKLKVGGVLYISYNTQPGWAPMAPVRDLLTEHASVMGAAGSGSLARVDQSFGFVDRLFATNPLFLRANPNAKTSFDKAKAQNPAYLAHEYFNRDWVPIALSAHGEVAGACQAELRMFGLLPGPYRRREPHARAAATAGRGGRRAIRANGARFHGQPDLPPRLLVPRRAPHQAHWTRTSAFSGAA